MKRMKENEFGVKLNRNGYAPSLLQPNADEDNPQCWACGEYLPNDPMDRHEIFGGALREKSKRLGLWVYLHHFTCHEEGPRAVHQDAEAALELKQAGQQAAMEAYGWDVEDFIREFGRNYL